MNHAMLMLKIDTNVKIPALLQVKKKIVLFFKKLSAINFFFFAVFGTI